LYSNTTADFIDLLYLDYINYNSFAFINLKHFTYFECYLRFINKPVDSNYSSNTNNNYINSKENNKAINKIKVMINLPGIIIKAITLMKVIMVIVKIIAKHQIIISYFVRFN